LRSGPLPSGEFPAKEPLMNYAAPTQIPSFYTHTFWGGGKLTNVERTCLNSLVKNGHKLVVWSYNDIKDMPTGSELKDAREILPESSFFLLSNGSCAPFSDFFRYTVLDLVGGLWVDTDVIALKPTGALNWENQFLVTERLPTPFISGRIKKILRKSKAIRVNNNVIYNPKPGRGNIIDMAQWYCQRFPKDKVTWSQLGPDLLSAIESIYPEHGFDIHPPEYANSVDYWRCPAEFFTPGRTPNHLAVFVHLYGQTWAEAKIDKNGSFPKGSMMRSFADEYI
jgi:hypothetical protein